MKSRIIIAIATILLLSSTVSAEYNSELLSPPPASESEDSTALKLAVQEACDKRVVLLGENGFHGDGRIVAFRSLLIQRLVQACGFKAVFFEASHYDFLAIDREVRLGRPVTPDMISSAIGGKWNNDRELESLVSFLARASNAGHLSLGGLDDQAGQRGSFYSLKAMPAELARFLGPKLSDECANTLQQRLNYSFPKYMTREDQHTVVEQCLTKIRAAIVASASEGEDRKVYLEMAENLLRNVARENLSSVNYNADRDHSMFLNLTWLDSRLPRDTKIIIWAENGHVRKDAGEREDSSGPPLGFYVHQAYKKRAFSIGSTAGGGYYRYDAHITRPIQLPPFGSIEATVLAEDPDTVIYVGPSRLRKFGSVSAGAFDDHKQKVALWRDIYDALIVFRLERPPFRKDGT